MASEYKRSISWIQKQIYEYEPVYKIHTPRAVNLVCDATLYGKKIDKLGTLVFKDSITKEVLIWKHIQSETIKDYKYLRLNEKNGCFETQSKYGILVRNKGLFTDDCKKVLKVVQNANKRVS